MNNKNEIVILGTKAEGIDKVFETIKNMIDEKSKNKRFHISKFHISDLKSWQEKIKDSKFILLLRNPAEHSFELWKYMLCEGFEWIDDFEIALQREQSRFFGSEHIRLYGEIWDYFYWHSGLYYEKIKVLIEAMGKEKFSKNTALLILDEIQSSDGLFYKIKEFLGEEFEISRELKKIKLSDVKISIKKIPMNSKMQYIMRVAVEEAKIKFNVKTNFLKPFMKLNIFAGKEMKTHWCVDFLKESFKEDVEKLSEEIKKDLIKIWY